MTKEEFNNIVKTPSKSLLDENSIEAERNRFASKKWREWVIDDLNYMGNEVHSNRSGDAYLRKLYTSNVFTDKEWDVLLPGIFYRDYNKDFDQLAKKVIPLFNRIREFWGDLHLEIWQGIFSFGTHWCTEGKSPKESINSPENGKLYCDTLLEIYPIFKKFIDKWGDHYTLFRFCEAVGPGMYRGLLYEQQNRAYYYN